MNKLKLSIDNESVNIYIDRGDEIDPIHIVYWHLDEVEEDADVAISMCKAIDLFYSNPKELLDKLGYTLEETEYNVLENV